MELPTKPHRKNLEVPVHRGDEGKKTFGANFHSKRYKDDVGIKVSRKYLSRENSRLLKENEEVVAKFNELEELSLRKILRLKEKISTLQAVNEEVSKENNNLKDEVEMRRFCKNCEDYQIKCHKLQEENQFVRNENKDLNEDLNMLKTVVYRLNVQMERYQEKLRSLKIKMPQTTPQHQTNEILVIDNSFSDLHKDHSHTPISWGRVNSHTLGPLLDAYQDTINEKDEIIETYEKELSEFTGKLKTIVKENEELHKNLNDDIDCSEVLKKELTKLKGELKSVKEQNDVLIKKCALKQDKLEEVIKCYEMKVEQMKRDYSVLHEQYVKCVTEVTALKQRNQALVDLEEDFKSERQNYIPLTVHTASVNECKRWYEELKQQYDQEKVKLKDNIDVTARKVEDLERRLQEASREKEECQNVIKSLEKNLKKNESKYLELEHTLNEVQFAKSACRKQLNKAMNFARDLVGEQEALLRVLNDRQQENKVVKRIGSDMATRMEMLKNQLKEVQKDAWQELTTVEKRIQDQNQAMEVLKQEHSEEIQKLQKVIKEQESNFLSESQVNLPVSHYLLFRDKHK